MELSQSRGAVGGEKFCKLLDPDYEKDNDMLSFEEIVRDLSVQEESKLRDKLVQRIR